MKLQPLQNPDWPNLDPDQETRRYRWNWLIEEARPRCAHGRDVCDRCNFLLIYITIKWPLDTPPPQRCCIAPERLDSGYVRVHGISKYIGRYQIRFGGVTDPVFG